MARPTLPEADRKCVYIRVHVTFGQRNRLERLATQLGCKTGEFTHRRLVMSSLFSSKFERIKLASSL